jgi:hypothetical protein
VHAARHGVGDVERGQPAVRLQEDAYPVSPVGHLGEVVPVEDVLVGAQRHEPAERVRDVVEPRTGMEVVPVDQADRLVVPPDEVPGSGIPVAQHEVVARNGRGAPDRVVRGCPAHGRVVDAPQEAGRGDEALIGVLVEPAVPTGLTSDEAQGLAASLDPERLGNARHTTGAEVS